MINDVPERPTDRRTHGARAAGATVAALVATSIAFAGCGGGGSTSSTTTSAAAPTTSTSHGTTPSSASTTNTGGGSGAGHVGQHLTIPQAVEAVLIMSDRAKACGSDYVTSHYLSAAYGGKEGCLQAQNSKSAAKSVRVDDVFGVDTKAPPVRAAAKVVPQGGIYDGEKLTVSLVKEDGTWKVDSLKSNAPVGP